MKKLISLIVCIFVIGSLVGCSKKSEESNNNVNTADKGTKIEYKTEDGNLISKQTAESILKNKDKYNFLDDIENKLKGKKPYVYTYYLDESELDSEEIGEVMLIEMTYLTKPNEESTALKIYSQYHEIGDMKIDEFNGIPSNNYKDTTYKVNDYSEQKPVFMNEELVESFIGQNINKLNDKFNVNHGKVEAFIKGSNLKVNFYLIGKGSQGSNQPCKGMYVLTEDSIIKGMKVDEPFFKLEELDKLFDSKTY